MADDATLDPADDARAGGVPGAFDDPELVRAAELLAGARRVVVLTGAGISTDSGIPDFRGPNGVWTRDPEAEKLSTIDVYLSDPEVRRRAWLRRLDNPAWVADPNPGHLAIRDLDRQGRLHLLVTQNIDGLHLAAGHDPGTVVQVHGSLPEAHCTRCDWSGPTAEVLDRVRAGEADPPCPDCEGIIKPRIVFFGEELVADDIERAFRAAEEGDLLLAVGTTLSVYPVARMVPIAAGAGVPIVIVNGSETEMDFLASAVVRGSISEVLPQLVAGVG
jgi:NAD-dependent deacetylase